MVREAVVASIPLAGWAALSPRAIARLAAENHGRPFAAACMTEDYELGLRIGAFADKTMFVRIPAVPGSRSLVSSKGHFPATLDAAVRQKSRWIGGIALSGWERLGWRGGIGERWMRMRDRRGPLAALLLVAGYAAILLWLQLWIASKLGAPVSLTVSPALAFLLTVNAVLLAWRWGPRRIRHRDLRPRPGPAVDPVTGGRNVRHARGQTSGSDPRRMRRAGGE